MFLIYKKRKSLTTKEALEKEQEFNVKEKSKTRRKVFMSCKTHDNHSTTTLLLTLTDASYVRLRNLFKRLTLCLIFFCYAFDNGI